LKSHDSSFLEPPDPYGDLDKARAVIVPFPFEGGVSYGLGAAGAPDAVLEASRQVEFYDDVLDAEPYRVGIGTLAVPAMPYPPEQMVALLARLTGELLDGGKFPVVIGGDHSISTGFARSIAERFPSFGVVQLDAHADLRDSYEGNRLSHASVMARIRELTPHTLQLGIRSMAAEEARIVKEKTLCFCTMRQWRSGRFDLKAALAQLPEKVFITLDVDVFDWSVISGTGTPEPGGLYWDEALDLLKSIFDAKDVIGCDVVELAYRPGDINSSFALAKLIYKMIGFKFAGQLKSLT
jgi:agmatinase